MTSYTPQQIAELERKANAYDELVRIISATPWNAIGRVVYAGARRLAANGRRVDGWRVVEMPMWEIQKRLGVSPRTCRDTLKKLKGAGLVEWEVERPAGGDYNDAITTLKVRECMPPEFAPLPLTENGQGARRHAVEFRARKNQLEQIVKSLECPKCHKTGCMHVTIGAECGECHATMTPAELESKFGVGTLNTPQKRRRALANLKDRYVDDAIDPVLDHVAKFATPLADDRIIEPANFAEPPERALPDIASYAACTATTQGSTEGGHPSSPDANDEIEQMIAHYENHGEDWAASLADRHWIERGPHLEPFITPDQDRRLLAALSKWRRRIPFRWAPPTEQQTPDANDTQTGADSVQYLNTELLPLWDDRVTTGADTLAKLADAGAEFCRVHHRHAPVDKPGKRPFGDGPKGTGWKTPATLAVVAEHVSTGSGNAGLLTHGHIKISDADDRNASFLAHCERNGRAMTKLIVRRDAWPIRGKCAVCISDPDNLEAEKFRLSRDRKARPVFEILSNGNQAVVAGIHTSGATIEFHDLGGWVEMTADEFRALVVAWLDSEYPADQYPDATWRETAPPLNAQTLNAPGSSVAAGDVQQRIWKWIAQHGADVMSALGNPKPGQYISLRDDDDTPSALCTWHDGRVVFRDYGSDECLDLFDIKLRREGIEKRVAIGRLMNGRCIETGARVVEGAR